MSVEVAYARRTQRRDPERFRHDGFHELNIFDVRLDDGRLSWEERQLLIGIGERLWGKREQRNGARR